jgi:hypothetical protein
MPLAPVPRPPSRARLFAALALLVAPTGAIAVGWNRGILPLDGAWTDKLLGAAMSMHDSLGRRGPIAMMIDWSYTVANAGLTPALFGAQTILSLMLAVAAVATLRGDEAGAWSMRHWAWPTFILDGVNLAATGGVDAASWLRVAFAAAVVTCLPRPFDPAVAGPGPIAGPDNRPTSLDPLS